MARPELAVTEESAKRWRSDRTETAIIPSAVFWFHGAIQQRTESGVESVSIYIKQRNIVVIDLEVGITR